MVGFYSTIPRFCALLICVLPFACIEETGDLAGLPEDRSLSKIIIKDTYPSAASAWGNIVDSGTRMEISWGTQTNFNPLSFSTLPKRTIVTLTNAKLVKEINTSFNDNKTINDYFEYDNQQRITKLRRQDEANGLEYMATFYYKSNILDSIALEHSVTVSGKVTKQTGFFKKADARMFVSIFPFDPAEPYTLTDSDLGTHIQGWISNTFPKNYLNKWAVEIEQSTGYNNGVSCHVDLIMRVKDQSGATNQHSNGQSTTTIEPGYDAFQGSIANFYSRGIQLEDDFSNQGISYPILFSEYFPNPFLLDQVFYRFEYAKKLETVWEVNYEINYDYDWNFTAP